MNSPTDDKLVERFVKNKRFRHRETPKLYAGILRGFQRFIATHDTDGTL